MTITFGKMTAPRGRKKDAFRECLSHNGARWIDNLAKFLRFLIPRACLAIQTAETALLDADDAGDRNKIAR